MVELINLNNSSSSVKYNHIIEEILIHSRFAKKLVDRFIERIAGRGVTSIEANRQKPNEYFLKCITEK